MDSTAALLKQIKAFLAATRMSPTYFGKKCCGNAELVRRLEEGGDITLRTADRVRQFINEGKGRRIG